MSRVYYGGQAVIEGVMMRGPRDVSVAVRDPAGQIVTRTEPLGGIYTSRWSKLPVVRGVVMLWDSLELGLRTLMFSANVSAGAGDDEKGNPRELMPKGVMLGTLVSALAFAMGLFFVLPVVIMGFLDRFLGSPLASNLIEKVIRLALILGYIGGVGLIPEIRRVYAYHGAEHKTINAFEAGAPLDVESVRPFSTQHPRCGTTFLIVVVLVSFVLFLLLGQPPILLRILSRIVLIPLIAGIAYELIRLGADNYRRPLARAIMVPGLAVQRMTTREPDDSQIETAIQALTHVLEAERTRRLAEVPRTAVTASLAG